MKKISFISALILALSLILSSCNTNNTPSDFTVTVKSEWGQGFADIDFRVYSDEDLTDLVWAQNTDSDGTARFKADAKKEYFAVIDNIPLGFEAEEVYNITESETEILLTAHLLPEESLSETSFGLGDVFLDFTVTDTNGETYKLSELLKAKKAVVLNFWFMNCDPCRMEFPYLEKAYKEYSDSLEVIAINPLDGTNEKISAYAKNLELTFPMVSGDSAWGTALGLNAYPTTVVIDRYGIAAMMHKGAITEDGQFEKIFEFFTSDDYTHTTVRNLSDIK